MTAEIAIVLAILLGSMVLFVTGWIRMDLVALLVLAAVSITGVVTPVEALAGFSSPAVVTIWAMFIISGGLIATGVAGALGQRITRAAGDGEVRLIVATMATAGILSGFMNNVGVAAMMLPVVIDMARRTGRRPSRLLMPLGVASLLGGLTTMIGTPPNILVADAVRDQDLVPFGLFDFTPIGIAILAAGIAFVALVGRHLLPDREPAWEVPEAERDPTSFFELGERLLIVRIPPDSSLAGKTLGGSRLGSILRLTVVAVIRNRRTVPAPGPGTLLLGGDRLLALGRPEYVEEVQEARLEGAPESQEILTAVRELRIESYPAEGLARLQSADIGLAEIVLSPETKLVGHTLRDLEFRDRYGLSVLAIWRQGRAYRTGLSDMDLRFGDAILVHGGRDRLRMLAGDPDFVVVSGPAAPSPRREKSPVALVILALLLAPVVVGWLPIAIASVTAAALMVLTRCLSMEEAYRFIHWPAVFLIAGMLPLGVAMERSGAAAFLASGVLALIGELGPRAVLAGVFLMTACASVVVPPAAVIVLMVPVAMSAAADLGVSPLPFMMTLAMAAAPLASPISHPAHTLLMGPGGYRFADYLRIGVPLTLIALALVLVLIPILWPFIP
jgi:di/tricarboxylate transporter